MWNGEVYIVEKSEIRRGANYNTPHTNQIVPYAPRKNPPAHVQQTAAAPLRNQN